MTGRPDGPALVFGHGFGCDQTAWRFVAPAFAVEHGCVLFDHVGCGRSDVRAFDEARHGRLEGYAGDVLELLAALGIAHCTFIGHSASATIAMLAAIAEPARFARLVLLAPSPCFIDDLPEYQGGFAREEVDELLALMERNPVGWATVLAPMATSTSPGAPLTRELAASFDATPPHAARSFARAIFYGDYRAVLPRVPVPALIVQCARDRIAPRSVGEYMHRHMARSTLEVLDAAGHCPHLSHPVETIGVIREYLDGA